MQPILKVLHITNDPQQRMALREINDSTQLHIINISECERFAEIPTLTDIDIAVLDMETATSLKAGYDAISQLQQSHKTLPIIVVFAEENERDVMRAVSMGVQDYFRGWHRLY